VTRDEPVWVRDDEILRTRGPGRLHDAGEPVLGGIGVGYRAAPPRSHSLGLLRRTRRTVHAGDVH
jgi:hypothetical protein